MKNRRTTNMHLKQEKHQQENGVETFQNCRSIYTSIFAGVADRTVRRQVRLCETVRKSCPARQTHSVPKAARGGKQKVNKGKKEVEKKTRAGDGHKQCVRRGGATHASFNNKQQVDKKSTCHIRSDLRSRFVLDKRFRNPDRSSLEDNSTSGPNTLIQLHTCTQTGTDG